MNVKPVRHQNVLIRLAKISKAQKQAAKAAAAEAKAAAQAAQGADEFVKTGMKSPKFKKWAVRIAAALGAAGAITAGAILSKPRTYDAPLEARMRAYAEYRDYTERAAESFAFDYYDYAFRNATMMEVQAEGDQRKLDRRAFSDILKDHGYKEAADRIENSYKYDEKIFPILTEHFHHTNKQRLLDKKLNYLKENMTTKEYQRFIKNMEEVNRDNHMPYYGNVLGQYTADSIAFRKYLDKTGIVHDSGVMRDFRNICKAIRPDYDDYSTCYSGGSYKPFYIRNKDDLLESARDKYTFYK